MGGRRHAARRSPHGHAVSGSAAGPGAWFAAEARSHRRMRTGVLRRVDPRSESLRRRHRRRGRGARDGACARLAREWQPRRRAMTGRFPLIKDPVDFTERLEALFRQAEAHPDPAMRELALDLSEAVMHLHHEALLRIVVLLGNLPGGARVLEVLHGDQVVVPLLAEHGLLEDASKALEAQVVEALEKVRP